MRKLIYIILLLLITGGVYASIHRAELVWNDSKLPAVAASSSWQPSPGKRFEPLTPGLLHLLDQVKAGGGSSGDHWARTLHDTSLALHAASVVMVFLIIALLLQTEGAAFLGAALFALHPLQTEAVAYASSLKVVLGSFLALFALWQYLVYAKGLETGPRIGRGRRSYAIATVAFALAVLADTAMIVTPLIAWLLTQLLPKQTSLYKATPPAWRLAVWLVIAAGAAAWTSQTKDTTALAQVLPVWLKPVVAGDAVSFYLAKIAVPFGIGPDYGRSPIVVSKQWWGYLTWLAPVLLLVALGAVRSKERSWLQVPLLVFIAALLPVLGLVYFPAQTTSTVANRYAYLALLGPALYFAFAAAKARRAWVPVLMLGVLLACGVVSQREVQHWQSNDRLWQHALEVNPVSPIAHLVQGNRAMQAGDWQKARADYMQVLAANAFSPSVYFNLGEIEREHGDGAKAVAYYQRALDLSPGLPGVHDRLGSTYLALGDRVAAQQHFTKAVELSPDNEEAQRLLGMLLVRKGADAQAIPYLQKAVQLGDQAAGIDPERRAASHALLGLALRRTNQPQPAKEHLETALKLAPNSREANRALADIHFSQGQLDLARPHYEKAVAQGDKDFAVYDALGIICMSSKEYSKAVPQFMAALSLQPDAVETLQNIGISYYHLRQQKDAATSFKKALELNPNLAASHYYLGDIARWQNKEPEALHEYQLALKIDPNYADAHYRLGNYYLKNDQLTLAVQQFEAGLKSAPDDPKLQFGLKKAEKARMATAAPPASGDAGQKTM